MSTRKSKSLLYRENLELKRKLQDAENDRDEFRKFFRDEMKTQLSNLTEQKYSSPDVLIKRIVNTISKARPFHIWW